MSGNIWYGKIYLPIRTLALVNISYTQEFEGNRKRFLWNRFESSI